MAVTAEQKLQNAIVVTKTVKAASTATIGKVGKYDSTDELTVLDASAGDNGSVVFLETAAAGAKVQCVQLAGSSCVVPVKVGTGGATAGAYAIVVSDGLTDKTLGGGTTVRYIVGKFTQTGVVGDMVGLAPGPFAGVSS
jgi:hypothetical protein